MGPEAPRICTASFVDATDPVPLSSRRVGKVGGGAEGRVLYMSKYSAFKGVREHTCALIFIRETNIICFPKSYLLSEEARRHLSHALQEAYHLLPYK